MDSRGRIHTGTLDAANERDLEQRLVIMGMDLIKSKVLEDRMSFLFPGKIRRIDLINFCFHMEQLTRSGVSILDGLVDLRGSVESSLFRTVVANLIDDIETGKNLSAAMAQCPAAFDEMIVNLIKAGEESGQLPEVFRSLTDMLKWQDELISTTKKILMLPAFLGIVILLVVGFLMIYLVPQLVSFIEGIGSELPFHTKALIATSDFCVEYWYVLTIGPVAFFFFLKAMSAISENFRYRIDGLKLRIWKVGPVLRKIILSRFANLFAMMYKSGIPVLQCIEITERTINNYTVKSALTQVREDIQEGKGVSDSFHNTGLFPPLVVRMLRIGETTGKLDDALLNVRYFYDRDVKDSIETVQALIQPIMTVFMGALLGWVMMSVMGPVYNSISTLQL